MAWIWILRSRSLILVFLLATLFDFSQTGFPLFGTTTGCDKRLTNPRGSISSPNYPNDYDKNTACQWIITVDDSESVINLHFDYFALENHPQCRYDYLLVRDGDSEASPIIGKYCGNSLPKDIRSSSNRLWLRFYSDSVFNGKGFHAVYSQIKRTDDDFQRKKPVLPNPTPASCGGQLSTESGQIESPGFPSRYPHSTECIWIISNKNPLLSISFSFDSFALEDTPQCQYDYVQVEDISSRDVKMLGKFCGSKAPLNDFIGEKLRVTFKSDASSSDIGFKGKWKTVSSHHRALKNSACGGEKTGVVGFVRSNNYPENYKNNDHCEWKISASQTQMKIQLRFSSFDIEPSADCEYDYIEVFDGEDKNSPSLGKFCGRHVPEMVESTGSKVLLVFNTDGSDTRAGFEIVWVAVYKHGETGTESLGRKARVPDTSLGSCGGLFHSESGVIKTPNYPSNYPANSLCTWVIKSSDTSEIKMTFKSFDLERQSDCKYDRLVIRDGSTDTSKSIGKYCGDVLPSVVRSSSNALWIQFKSDGSKQSKGFEASWQKIEKSGLAACGTRFTSSTGQITSPNYPSSATNRKFCTWIIDVPQASKIKLTFKDINMASSSGCSYGYVQVFDGDSAEYPELGRFCHSFLPRPIISSGNKLMIGFQPDGSRNSRGFKAEWTSVQVPTIPPVAPDLPATPCGSTLTAESGNIILPKGATACSWIVRPTSGKRITLSVVKVNLLSNPRCTKEVLEIRNGFTSVAPLLLRICGRLQPKTVKSFTGVLRITYSLKGRSNNPYVNLYWTTLNGIRKKYNVNQASCGIIKVPHQKLLSDRALVTSGSLPWMAALLSGAGSITCGAAILSPNWAITAAHCFKRSPFYAFRKVMVGELNLLESEGTEQELKIKLVHIHPSYNAVTNENDIALINLNGKVTLNDKVNTICLPANNTQFSPGTVCSTAGWGTRRFLGRPSKPLVLARLPLVATGRCNSTKAYRGNIKDGMLCAGRARGGLDTCQGDGGGPLTCEIMPGKQVLVGISSWGNGCASPYKYGVYTDVRRYIKWIESIIDP